MTESMLGSLAVGHRVGQVHVEARGGGGGEAWDENWRKFDQAGDLVTPVDQVPDPVGLESVQAMLTSTFTHIDLLVQP